MSKRLVRLVPIGPIKMLNRMLRNLTAYGHRLQFEREWASGSETPGWFDHFIDQFWKWPLSRNPQTWERGIFGLLGMKEGCSLLDLCCGGGFITCHFYSGRASSIIAVDYDPTAIRHAKRNFKLPNIDFRCSDIRTQMPEGKFDNVTWDAGIEYFTRAETHQILRNIRGRLKVNGLLGGYAIVAKESKSHQDHKQEFSSREQLADLLKQYFDNVLIVSTAHGIGSERRNNMYFFASDGPLPFDEIRGTYLRVAREQGRDQIRPGVI
jgi:ubiquinone/menaquinone biosynthesis C-methylase UbiE